MSRRKGLLLILTFLPALTLLGSVILMNDYNSASRRGMLSVALLFMSMAELILFSFFIGYLPKTNQMALRMGCVFFFLFLVLYLLRMGQTYNDYFSDVPHDEGTVRWIVYSLIAIMESGLLFVLGYFIPHKRRKKQWEEDHEDNPFR